MGYRDKWISNTGAAVPHFEDAIQALDKYQPPEPVRMLHRGSGKHLWEETLPVGSVIDTEPDKHKYDVIVDSVNPAEWWAWLMIGGLLFAENVPESKVQKLVQDVCADRDSWLPAEEIMSLRVYPHILIVEKRNPRVMEYLHVYTGGETDEDLQRQGVKRLTVQ